MRSCAGCAIGTFDQGRTAILSLAEPEFAVDGRSNACDIAGDRVAPTTCITVALVLAPRDLRMLLSLS